MAGQNTQGGSDCSFCALTEPGSGSDVANTASTATLDGDALYSSRREDLYLQRRIADFYVILRANGRSAGRPRTFTFLLPADTRRPRNCPNA